MYTYTQPPRQQSYDGENNMSKFTNLLGGPFMKQPIFQSPHVLLGGVDRSIPVCGFGHKKDEPTKTRLI